MIFTTFDIETCTGGPKWWDLCVGPGSGFPDLEWVKTHASDYSLCPYDGMITCWSAITWSASPDSLEVVAEDTAVVAAAEDPRAEVSEFDLLVRLGAYLDGDHGPIVAHNGNGFDFGFVRARAIHHNLPSLAESFWQPKPWSGKLIDTGEPAWAPPAITKGNRRGMPTLDRLAALIGIQRPPQVAGKDAPGMWLTGGWDAVAFHCHDDVVCLGRVFARLLEARGWRLE
ncbi:MAG: hypothetical protein HOP09_14825 [Hyphomicrobium sp.]|nr:hypothetical protein [Hyphomicrobium sp.]